VSKKRKPDPPSLWIIAGANGSGKTTAYHRVTIEAPRGSIWIINPDELAQRISSIENLALGEANRVAVERIETWLYSSIEAYQTVGVETVLSTDKYRKLVDTARQRNFKIRLLYFYLKHVDLNVERVKIRVKKGGHAVPERKIRDRRVRSLEQLKWFFAQSNTAHLFDNSGAEPVLTVRKKAGRVTVYGELIPEIDAAVSPSGKK
jgi:predicted ABC-type ATPase